MGGACRCETWEVFRALDGESSALKGVVDCVRRVLQAAGLQGRAQVDAKMSELTEYTAVMPGDDVWSSWMGPDVPKSGQQPGGGGQVGAGSCLSALAACQAGAPCWRAGSGRWSCIMHSAAQLAC